MCSECTPCAALIYTLSVLKCLMFYIETLGEKHCKLEYQPWSFVKTLWL